MCQGGQDSSTLRALGLHFANIVTSAPRLSPVTDRLISSRALFMPTVSPAKNSGATFSMAMFLDGWRCFGNGIRRSANGIFKESEECDGRPSHSKFGPDGTVLEGLKEVRIFMCSTCCEWHLVCTRGKDGYLYIGYMLPTKRCDRCDLHCGAGKCTVVWEQDATVHFASSAVGARVSARARDEETAQAEFELKELASWCKKHLETILQWGLSTGKARDRGR